MTANSYCASVPAETRPPPRSELVAAFRAFFSYKYQYSKRVNSTQAHQFRQVFNYLVRRNGSTADEGLTVEDLRIAREALLKPPSSLPVGSAAATSIAQEHLDLCRDIYAELLRRRVANPIDFKMHVEIMCQYGASLEATEMVAQYMATNEAKRTQSLPQTQSGDTQEEKAAKAQGASASALTRRDKELYMIVLRGLANEGHENALLAEASNAQAAGLEYMPLFHELMSTFFARKSDFYKFKQWFEKPIHNRQQPTAQTFSELLALSQRIGNEIPKPKTGIPTKSNVIISMGENTSEDGAASILAEKRRWIQDTFQALCDSNPTKDKWDVIFQWAVISLDKGVDDIRHMIETMLKHNSNRPDMDPDAATINGLIRVAAARGDALLAERFIQLGASDAFDIVPDAQTFILQLDYRIDAKDLSGAYASYMHLQNLNCSDEEDAAVINKYLRALCEAARSKVGTAVSPAKNFNPTGRIVDVLDVVENRQTSLESATIVDLCMTFLECDQQYEVIDVLSVYGLQYSVEERGAVRDAFVEYIVDRKRTSTARAWDAYSLLRQFFAETPPESRLRMMEGFFRRRRPDMACYIFGHMRGADTHGLRPTADMYVQCLEGLGKSPDMTSLRMIHNMLKMDTLVQVSTRIYNALMLAYAASGEPDRALDFWHDISASHEGPSYSSLAIVFWACEKLGHKEAFARSIWAKLQRMEIDVPPNVFDAYVGALAGQGLLDDAKKLVGGMEKTMGYGPTVQTLGLTCNALPGQDLQAEFAEWAAQEYPEVWEQVTQKGCGTTVMGLRRYKVTRELKA